VRPFHVAAWIEDFFRGPNWPDALERGVLVQQLLHPRDISPELWIDLCKSCERLSISIRETDIRGCNDNVVAQIKSSPIGTRLHTGSAVARELLAAEQVVGTWASVDLAAAIRKLASVALKARRQNEF
jgi:hypothetical protein